MKEGQSGFMTFDRSYLHVLLEVWTKSCSSWIPTRLWYLSCFAKLCGAEAVGRRSQTHSKDFVDGILSWVIIFKAASWVLKQVNQNWTESVHLWVQGHSANSGPFNASSKPNQTIPHINYSLCLKIYTCRGSPLQHENIVPKRWQPEWRLAAGANLWAVHRKALKLK